MQIDLTSVEQRWKVSAKWALHRLDCTLYGIVNRCHGVCCQNMNFWPPSSNVGGTGCAHLGPQGCTLSQADKPITCLLYPLKLNDSGTLIVHYRGMNHCCKPNVGLGPTIIEAVRPHLAAVFGEDVAERVTNEVLAGKDSYIDVSPEIIRQWNREMKWHDDNAIPLPRSQ